MGEGLSDVPCDQISKGSHDIKRSEEAAFMLHQVLLVFAFVLFVVAAFSVPVPRVNLLAAGLACWVASQLF